MRKQTVVLTSEMPEIASRILSRDFEVVVHPADGIRTEDELIAILSEADGAITILTDAVSRRVLASNANLRIVANCAVGTDNIDLDAARDLGIVVTNTPGVLTDATADLTLALMLALVRRVVEGDALLRSGGFHAWHPLLLLGSGLAGKRLGIVGYGRIGHAVAKRARSFGMEVVYASRSAVHPDVEREGAAPVPFTELLATSDIISIHCPLTPDTRHLFDRRALESMKRGSYLINTARGPIVDETALADALESGWIRGAGLDVFENEPAVEPGLLHRSDVVLLPHLGSATEETRIEMARMAATNVSRALRGQAPVNPVVAS